jgi:hypothetical protein
MNDNYRMGAIMIDNYAEFICETFSKSEMRMIAKAYNGTRNIEPLIDALDKLITSNKRGLRKKAELLRKELCIACPGRSERVISETDIEVLRVALDTCGNVDEFLKMV